jgi:hypothetical protein
MGKHKDMEEFCVPFRWNRSLVDGVKKQGYALDDL